MLTDALHKLLSKFLQKDRQQHLAFEAMVSKLNTLKYYVQNPQCFKYFRILLWLLS